MSRIRRYVIENGGEAGTPVENSTVFGVDAADAMTRVGERLGVVLREVPKSDRTVTVNAEDLLYVADRAHRTSGDQESFGLWSRALEVLTGTTAVELGGVE